MRDSNGSLRFPDGPFYLRLAARHPLLLRTGQARNCGKPCLHKRTGRLDSVAWTPVPLAILFHIGPCLVCTSPQGLNGAGNREGTFVSTIRESATTSADFLLL